MHILLVAIGRDRRGPTADLVATYLERCPWRIETVDIPPRSQGDRERRLAEEATRIRQSLPPGAVIVILDERGENISSRGLADHIDRFRHDGRTTLAFIIGSADGLDASIADQADLKLAFGRATWPHRLVRAMLAEQLYRASTILTGHPYHRD